MNGSKIIDRLTIKQIIGVWTLGVIIFAAIYFSLSFTDHHLSYNNQSLTPNVNGFANSIYFSMMVALTIGYSSIVPLGYSKLIVLIEAIFSVLVFGILIAKIIATKQEEILRIVEDLSFEESTNNAISQLYIFRSDIRNISETKSSKNVSSQIKNFEDSLKGITLALKDIENATSKLDSDKKKNSFQRIELIIGSVNSSLSRTIELLEAFNHRKTSWKKESITTRINECIKVAKKLCDEYSFLKSESSTMIGEKLEDLDKTLQNLQEKISMH
ncbi:MAG TPA: ion channel [Allocoleopsis sp.]